MTGLGEELRKRRSIRRVLSEGPPPPPMLGSTSRNPRESVCQAWSGFGGGWWDPGVRPREPEGKDRRKKGWRRSMGEGQDRMGVQVKVQEEVGRAAGWGKSALSGKWERVGEVSAVHCGGRNSSAGGCELISSHCLPLCLRASGSGKSEPGAPQWSPPSSAPPTAAVQSGPPVPLLPPLTETAHLF